MTRGTGFGTATSRDVALRFDSRLDPEFFEALVPGGALRGLVGYAFTGYPVDLHVRRDWVSSSQHAVLHVGLNRLLDVEYRQGLCRLHVMRALRGELGADEAWSDWRPLRGVWDGSLESFLDRAVPWAAESRGAMGAVATRVYSPPGLDRWVLAQSFTLQFRDEGTRKAVFAGVKADIDAAFDPSPIDAFPHPMKSEIVAMFVDSGGDLLVGDVQPRRASEVPWAAAIGIVNARMLRLWLENDPEAAEILRATVRTRVALGLLPASTRTPRDDARVVPVSIVQSGMSGRLRDNTRAVAAALRARGIDEIDHVRLIEWSLSGAERVSSPLD